MKVFQKLWVLYLVLSALCVARGLYKMLVYKSNSVISSMSVNAYVGGDAYNYIINAGYATAWFVLATIFIIMTCTGVLMEKIDGHRLSVNVESKTNDETLLSSLENNS